MTSRLIDSGRDGAMASKVTLGCFARMRELHQWAHLNCFLVFQQPFQQTTLILFLTEVSSTEVSSTEVSSKALIKE